MAEAVVIGYSALEQGEPYAEERDDVGQTMEAAAADCARACRQRGCTLWGWCPVHEEGGCFLDARVGSEEGGATWGGHWVDPGACFLVLRNLTFSRPFVSGAGVGAEEEEEERGHRGPSPPGGSAPAQGSVACLACNGTGGVARMRTPQGPGSGGAPGSQQALAL